MGGGTNPQSTDQYKIGDFAEGGVIIWLTEDGQHGLVAAIEDLGTYAWSTQNVDTPADNKQPLPLSTPSAPYGQDYPGYQNQQGIIGINPTLNDYPAFQACENYTKTINGVTYNDWFLPSLTELSVMYSFADLINQVSQAHGGSAMDMVAAYWSSREGSSNFAWTLAFFSGLQVSLFKNRSYAVRCVRAF